MQIWNLFSPVQLDNSLVNYRVEYSKKTLHVYNHPCIILFTLHLFPSFERKGSTFSHR